MDVVRRIEGWTIADKKSSEPEETRPEPLRQLNLHCR